MTTAVHNLLSSFDALPPDEQYQAALEILRRVPVQEGDLTEAALAELADERFRSLDEDEDEQRHAAS